MRSAMVMAGKRGQQGQAMATARNKGQQGLAMRQAQPAGRATFSGARPVQRTKQSSRAMFNR